MLTGASRRPALRRAASQHEQEPDEADCAERDRAQVRRDPWRFAARTRIGTRVVAHELAHDATELEVDAGRTVGRVALRAGGRPAGCVGTRAWRADRPHGPARAGESSVASSQTTPARTANPTRPAAATVSAPTPADPLRRSAPRTAPATPRTARRSCIRKTSPIAGRNHGRPSYGRGHDREAELRERRRLAAAEPLGGPRPQVGGHQDARPRVAHGVHHAPEPPDVRHPVERQRDLAAPRVLDPVAGDLRVDVQHPAEEQPRRPVDRGREEAHPPAEEQPAVRRHVPVRQEVLGVEVGAPGRRQLVGEIRRERLGGDDVAPDRHDPAADARGGAVRVPVRRDEDVPGEDRAPARLDHEPPVALAPDPEDRRPLVEIGAGPLGEPDEAGEPLGRMEDPAGIDRQAAVVGVRPDLLAEAVLRDDLGTGAELGERLGLMREVLEVARRPGQLEPAAGPELGIDAVVPDEPERRARGPPSTRDRSPAPSPGPSVSRGLADPT